MHENAALLLVDDRPENLIALQAVLDGQGLDLVTATSGNDALRHTLKRDFALVLLDVQMPDMDGFETAELMRANPKTRNLPIIFITAGMKHLQLQFKGYDLGAVDYLIKPFEPHVLQSKVRVFAELHRQRSQLETHQLQLEARILERVSQLRDSEERFRLLATHSPVGIFQVDAAGHCLFVNQRWCEISGLSSAQATGQGWMHTIDADDRAAVASSWHDALAIGAEWSRDFRYRRPDGKITWVTAAAAAQRDATGAIVGYLGSTLDITARKQAEARERTRGTVMEKLAHGTPLPEILDLLVTSTEPAEPGNSCAILLVDESGQHLLPAATVSPAADPRLISAEGPICVQAAHYGSSATITDISSDPACTRCRSALASAGPHSCHAKPITSMSGEVLGVLSVKCSQAAASDAYAAERIHDIIQMAGVAIERKRIEHDLHIAASVHQAVGEAITITDADNRIIAINPAFTRTTGYTSHEAIGNTPSLLASGRHGPAFYQKMWQSLSTTGRWQGEIWNRRKNGEEYPEWLSISTVFDDDGSVLRRIAMFSDITDQKRAEETIWRQANYDPLTELPNRRLFRDRLQQELLKAQRSGQKLALMFIDLDRFKEVNDTLGHHTGDLLLVEAAARISHCVRATDTVARLGGDEFTVIMADLSDSERVGDVAQKMLVTLSAPFHLGNNLAYVSASIGITLFPDDAVDVETLLRNADQAMYAAKEAGRNQFGYFTGSMQEIAQTRLQLSNDLRSALAAGQLEMYLQPIIELATGRIHKAEALMRWHHPVRGMVSPAEFIPLAEETGLITELGDWVFREAAQFAKNWSAQGHAPLQISVNKSPRQFFSGQSDETWVAYLKSIDLPADCIAIEITEGLLLDDRPEVAEKLDHFRAAGFLVSLDDFGTGYSAMAYLKKFPIDYLKVDQSFVRDMATDPGDEAIVEAIIVMAHKLGLKVIAEGVETTDQRDLLIAAGCDYVQGYLFARPMPAAQFGAFALNSPTPER